MDREQEDNCQGEEVGGLGGKVEGLRKKNHRHGQQCGDCLGEGGLGAVEEG